MKLKKCIRRFYKITREIVFLNFITHTIAHMQIIEREAYLNKIDIYVL